jgi:hypothetical protein
MNVNRILGNFQWKGLHVENSRIFSKRQMEDAETGMVEDVVVG